MNSLMKWDEVGKEQLRAQAIEEIELVMFKVSVSVGRYDTVARLMLSWKPGQKNKRPYKRDAYFYKMAAEGIEPPTSRV